MKIAMDRRIAAMSSEIENLSASFSLVRRELRDARALLSRLDHQLRRTAEPRAIHRPGGLVARRAAVGLIARAERRPDDAVARQYFPADRDLAQLIELKGAVAPGQATVAAWAADLAAVVVQDVADNLLPQSALAQLRAVSGQAYGFIAGAVAGVPVHTPAASGGFVAEAGAIPVDALIISALALRPKKAAAITALTRELANGAPTNVELSLRTLLEQDIGLMVDGILLGNTAASASAPAGLLNGITPLAATAGGGVNALLGDIEVLMSAIAPAVRPTLIMSAGQAVTFSIVAPAAAVPVVTAPYLTVGTVIALDAAAFASALGVPDIATDENPAVHMSDAPLPISTEGSPPTIAAPTSSLWQTASIGMRTLIDCDWLLRRTGAVAVVNGVTW
jgi:HK97 family phage major capsid protein